MTQRCQWGTCEAEATSIIHIQWITSELVGHPDWILGLEHLAVCDTCVVAAQAKRDVRWFGTTRLSADGSEPRRTPDSSHRPDEKR
jgi:hypothetical protein